MPDMDDVVNQLAALRGQLAQVQAAQPQPMPMQPQMTPPPIQAQPWPGTAVPAPTQAPTWSPDALRATFEQVKQLQAMMAEHNPPTSSAFATADDVRDIKERLASIAAHVQGLATGMQVLSGHMTSIVLALRPRDEGPASAP